MTISRLAWLITGVFSLLALMCMGDRAAQEHARLWSVLPIILVFAATVTDGLAIWFGRLNRLKAQPHKPTWAGWTAAVIVTVFLLTLIA